MMNYSWHGQSFGLSPLAFLGLGVLWVVIFLVVLILKGYSLWYAAKRNEPWWFLALFILNTVGILELIYLIFVVKRWNKPAVSTPTTPTI